MLDHDGLQVLRDEDQQNPEPLPPLNAVPDHNGFLRGED